MTVNMSTICPHCSAEHDAATQDTDVEMTSATAPQDGDASFCFSCGEFAIFEDAAPGGLRKLTKREARQIDGDRRLAQMQEHWRTITEWRRVSRQ